MTSYNAFQNGAFQSPGFQQDRQGRLGNRGGLGVRDRRYENDFLEFLRKRDAQDYVERTYEKALARGQAEAAQLRAENAELRAAIDSRRREPDVLRSLLTSREAQTKKLDLLKPKPLPPLDELLAA